MMEANSRDVYLQIVPVRLTSPNGITCSTQALLDTGSTCTLLRAETAKALELKGQRRVVNLSTVNDK